MPASTRNFFSAMAQPSWQVLHPGQAVVLDHEEGPGNLSNAIGLVHAAASAGTHTLLRAPWKEKGPWGVA